MGRERLVSLGLGFLALCHSLACVWVFVGLAEGEQGWLERHGYGDAPAVQQYVAGLYFIMATVTTVGYGDLTAQCLSEQAFTVGLMVAGVVAYSLTVGAVSAAMGASDRREQAIRAKLAVLADLRDQHGLGFELYWRVRQALHDEHAADRSEQQTLVAQLPSLLRAEVASRMYSRELQEVAFFREAPPLFLAEAAPRLRLLRVPRGEYVFSAGDALDGVYFLRTGTAAYVQQRPLGPDLLYASCPPGTCFGDIDFLPPRSDRRRFAVKALSDLELLLLPRADVARLHDRFRPELFRLFQGAAATLRKLTRVARKGE